MIIEEHIKGTISIPVYNENSTEYQVIDYEFSEDDIIADSCSITSKCCDDSTFSIGGVRPAELSIKLRINLESVNTYSMYGAKIRLYSIYQTEEQAEWVLRGEFWVTSAKRSNGNVYTIKASDALVWLDSGSYATGVYGQTKSEKDNPIYTFCVSWVRCLNDNFTGILDYINSQLTQLGIDNIEYYVRADITNNIPDGIGYALLPFEIAGSESSRSPRDYISYLAQIAAGCVQMITEPENTDTRKLFITPFGYTPTAGCTDDFRKMWETSITIEYDGIEQDGCEIADYNLYIQNTYVKTYEETGWSSYSTYIKYAGNITIDISGNPFVDGRAYNFNQGAPECTYGVIVGIGGQLGKFAKRPFSCKCHPQFAKMEDYPKLGQRIKIEETPGVWKESLITYHKWKFRGGWEFGCAGSDSRVLSQAAKKSLAKHAEESAKTYASIVANGANGGIAEAKQMATEAKNNAEDAWNYANDAQNNANSRVSQDDYNIDIADIYSRLSALETRES